LAKNFRSEWNRNSDLRLIYNNKKAAAEKEIKNAILKNENTAAMLKQAITPELVKSIFTNNEKRRIHYDFHSVAFIYLTKFKSVSNYMNSEFLLHHKIYSILHHRKDNAFILNIMNCANLLSLAYQNKFVFANSAITEIELLFNVKIESIDDIMYLLNMLLSNFAFDENLKMAILSIGASKANIILYPATQVIGYQPTRSLYYNQLTNDLLSKNYDSISVIITCILLLVQIYDMRFRANSTLDVMGIELALNIKINTIDDLFIVLDELLFFYFEQVYSIMLIE
jgi:hypothetical protein